LGVALTWRGVAGAASYEVARTDGGSGWSSWTTVAPAVTDQSVVYGASWVDTGAGLTSIFSGQPSYRIRARNLNGVVGPWSPVVVAVPAGLG